MLRTLHRSFSQQTQRVLDSLGLKLKAPVPQSETSDTVLPTEKVKVKLNSTNFNQVKSYDDSLKFMNAVDEKLDLPPRLDELNRKKEVVRNWIDNFEAKAGPVIQALEDPGPKGVYWFEAESDSESFDVAESSEFYPMMQSFKNYQKGPKISEEDFQNWVREIPDSDYKFYLGSKKGFRPEDDPENWAKWYIDNQPSKVLAASGGEWDPMTEMLEDDPQLELETTENMVYSDPRQIFLESEFDAHGYFKQNPEAALFEGSSDINTIASFAPSEIEGMLPVIPKNVQPDLIGFHESMNNWMSFRFVPLYFNYFPNLKEKLEQISKQNTKFNATTPGTLNYFETLPKWYRDHRLVQAASVLLDKHHPLMPRKKKEIFLNKLCNFLTPRSPEKYLFLQEYFIKPEIPEMALKGAEKAGSGDLQLSSTQKEEELDEVEKLLQETEDEDEQEVNDRMKRMLGEDTVVKDEIVYVPEEITDYGIDWFDYDTENPKGKIPCTLTYYDNQDGYWNDWIKVKRERIGMPEISVRKFFKH